MQILSYDIFHLYEVLPLLHRFSLFFGSLGFYVTNLMMVFSITCYLYSLIFFAIADVSYNQLGLVGSAIAVPWIVQIGFIQMFPVMIELIMEEGFFFGLGHFLVNLPLSVIFFLFQIKTTAYHFEYALTRGQGGYHATGRGFGLERVTLKRQLQMYTQSHLLSAVKLLFGVVFYFLVAQEPFFTKVIRMLSIILILVSWLLAPLLFNPWPTAVSLANDLTECLDWLMTPFPLYYSLRYFSEMLWPSPSLPSQTAKHLSQLQAEHKETSWEFAEWVDLLTASGKTLIEPNVAAVASAAGGGGESFRIPQTEALTPQQLGEQQALAERKRSVRLEQRKKVVRKSFAATTIGFFFGLGLQLLQWTLFTFVPTYLMIGLTLVKLWSSDTIPVLLLVLSFVVIFLMGQDILTGRSRGVLSGIMITVLVFLMTYWLLAVRTITLFPLFMSLLLDFIVVFLIDEIFRGVSLTGVLNFLRADQLETMSSGKGGENEPLLQRVTESLAVRNHGGEPKRESCFCGLFDLRTAMRFVIQLSKVFPLCLVFILWFGTWLTVCFDSLLTTLMFNARLTHRWRNFDLYPEMHVEEEVKRAQTRQQSMKRVAETISSRRSEHYLPILTSRPSQKKIVSGAAAAGGGGGPEDPSAAAAGPPSEGGGGGGEASAPSSSASLTQTGGSFSPGAEDLVVGTFNGFTLYGSDIYSLRNPRVFISDTAIDCYASCIRNGLGPAARSLFYVFPCSVAHWHRCVHNCRNLLKVCEEGRLLSMGAAGGGGGGAAAGAGVGGVGGVGKGKAEAVAVGSYRFLVVPVNNSSRFQDTAGGHWSVLLVDVANQRALHFDSSLRRMNEKFAKQVCDLLLFRFERQDGWCVQGHSQDCGVYALHCIEAIAKCLEEGVEQWEDLKADLTEQNHPFPQEGPSQKREDIVRHLTELAEQQRLPGSDAADDLGAQEELADLRRMVDFTLAAVFEEETSNRKVAEVYRERVSTAISKAVTCMSTLDDTPLLQEEAQVVYSLLSQIQPPERPADS